MSCPPVAESGDSLAPDFLDFIACLNERAVDAVLVGGYAAGVHGAVRATGDIDFLYRRTRENVRRLCAAMGDFGAPPNVIDFDTLMMPDMVTMFGKPPYRIDLLSDMTGVSFEQVWAGSMVLVIDGEPLRVIGLAELRANKAATGRAKDRQDLRGLPASDRSPSTAKGRRTSEAEAPARKRTPRASKGGKRKPKRGE